MLPGGEQLVTGGRDAERVVLDRLHEVARQDHLGAPYRGHGGERKAESAVLAERERHDLAAQHVVGVHQPADAREEVVRCLLGGGGDLQDQRGVVPLGGVQHRRDRHAVVVGGDDAGAQTTDRLGGADLHRHELAARLAGALERAADERRE